MNPINSSSKKRGGPLTRYWGEAFLWMLLALVVIEILLRVSVIKNPVLIKDSEWGIVPTSGSTRFWGKEGYGFTRYLFHGEISTPYVDGDISIVLLGDSYTEGLQVSDHLKYASVAEEVVRENGFSADIRNLGQSGNSIADYVYLAPKVIEYFDPELIIVQLSSSDFLGGDAFDKSRRNYFVYDETGNAEVVHKDTGFLENDFVFAIHSKLVASSLYSAGGARFSQLWNSVDFGIVRDRDEGAQRISYANPIIHLGTRINDQFRLLSEAYTGIDIVILLLPDLPRLKNDELIIDDIENIESIKNIINDFGEFSVIDPSMEFLNGAEENLLPRGFTNSIPGFGHLNRNGHAIVGNVLATRIMEMLD